MSALRVSWLIRPLRVSNGTVSTKGSEGGWPGSSSWGGITSVLKDGASSAPEKKSSSFSATAETA